MLMIINNILTDLKNQDITKMISNTKLYIDERSCYEELDADRA